MVVGAGPTPELERPPTGPTRRAPAAPGARLDGTESALLVLTRVTLRLALKVWARGGAQLEGLDRVPREGPLLICSNHVSNFDPLVYAAIVPRVLHALTKSELYEHPVMRTFLLHCNCIPVHRGAADRLALRSALAVLRSEGALLLFPEGHRAGPEGMLPFAPGAGYLALRARAAVLPCAIWGTELVLPKGRLLPRRAPVAVRFGEAFRPSATDPVRVSREIQARVQGMLPPAYRGLADLD